MEEQYSGVHNRFRREDETTEPTIQGALFHLDIFSLLILYEYRISFR
jgi:hypothetical protein